MKKILSLFFAIFIVSVSFVSASAVYYEDSFPSAETGLTGGLFLECSTNLGNCVIVIPYNFKEDTFTFSTSGNVFNATSSTVSGVLYRNGQQYSVRWSSFSYPQYRQSDSSYSYTDLVIKTTLVSVTLFITKSV